MREDQYQNAPPWVRAGLEELRQLGLSDKALGRARWTRISDAQALPTASGSLTSFFDTSTSDRLSNTYGRAGCTLIKRGTVDDNTVFLPRFIGVRVMAALGLTAAKAADFELIESCGMIDELSVNEQPILREVLLQECAEATGFRMTGHAAGPATFDGDGVSLNGGNGRNVYGRRIYDFERPGLLLRGGDQIKANVAQFSGTALTVNTHVLRVSLWGIEAPRDAA